MTEPNATPQPEKRRAPGWMKLLLALSLTANLCVLAMGAGMLLRGPDGRSERALVLALGPMGRAMDHQDRKAFLDFWRGRAGGEGAAGDRKAFVSDLAAALRADPPDPARLAEVLGRQGGAIGGQIARTHEALAEYLSTLPQDRRLALADRLQRRAP